MGALEEIQHRPVLLVEQTLRRVHLVVRGDANEILVEGPVVDGAEAEAVWNLGLSA